MKYVGMQAQIRHNNMYSILLLLMFPLIILGTVWVFLAIVNYLDSQYYDSHGNVVHTLHTGVVNDYFLNTIPWVIIGVGIWFAIAYFSHASMIRRATGARPLSRKENPRVYNIVENLCMTCNMDMPSIYVVDDPQLNAFASGIDKRTYAVTLTTGIIQLLDDDELAGVVAHELTHIRNRDTRLLITSIIFVGIISTLMSMIVQMMYKQLLYSGMKSKRSAGVSMFVILLVGLVCSAIAYLFTLITRFAISRRREYMADAGGAELCGNPHALASALRKISQNPGLDNVARQDVAQLFIMKPDEMAEGFMSFINSLFATHPDPQKRIEILEQF